MTKKLIYVLVIGSVLAALVAAVPALAKSQATLDSGTTFYVPKPNHGALEQIADLTSSGQKAEANLIQEMVETPHAMG